MSCEKKNSYGRFFHETAQDHRCLSSSSWRFPQRYAKSGNLGTIRQNKGHLETGVAFWTLKNRILECQSIPQDNIVILLFLIKIAVDNSHLWKYVLEIIMTVIVYKKTISHYSNISVVLNGIPIIHIKIPGLNLLLSHHLFHVAFTTAFAFYWFSPTDILWDVDSKYILASWNRSSWPILPFRTKT